MKTTLRARFLRLGILCATLMGLILVVVTTIMMFQTTNSVAKKTGDYIARNTSQLMKSEIVFIKETLEEAEITNTPDATFVRVFTYGSDTGYDYSKVQTLCAQQGELQLTTVGNSNILAAIKTADGTIKCGEMLMSYFDEILASFNANDGDFGFIVGTDNTVILAYNKAAIQGVDISSIDSFSGITSALNSKQIGNTVVSDAVTDGARYLYSYTPIGDYPAYGVAYATNYGAVVSSFYQMLITVVIIYVFLLGIGIFASFAAGNAVARAIKSVTSRLVALSEGDLNSGFTPNDRGDETQIISEALVSVLDSLGSYIRDIDNVLGKIAEGEINVSSEIMYKGDFESIGNSLEKITSSLGDTISTIKSAIVQFTGGSESVALGAKALADNSVQEAGTLERLNDMISNIKTTIDSTYNETVNANNLSEIVMNNVAEGNKNMLEMSEAVANIKEASDKIQSVVKIIDNIAFQTNILALNAAVEAARAGDAGKGFAVVAGEVRNLAAKSAEAVKNTVTLVNECSDAVAKGEMFTENANQSFARIDNSMVEFSSLIARIAASSAEQTRAIEEINSDIDSISGVITANSATAEESAAASEQLNTNAEVLNQKVEYFKI